MSIRAGLFVRALAAAVLLLNSLPAPAASAEGPVPEIRVPGAFFQPKPGAERMPVAPSDLVRASARLTAAELHDLGPLTAAESRRLQPEPPNGRLRQKIGIARDLVRPVVLSGFPSGLAAGTERSLSGGIARREPDGRLSWTTAFVSPGALAVRLHFAEAYLPQGSRVYVYTGGGEAHGPYSFEAGLGPEGFWTNSVAGEKVFLEVQLPAAASGSAPCRLVVSQVSHRAAPGSSGLAAEAVAAPEDTSCFVDAACVTTSDFGPVSSVSHAVAALDFMDTNGEFLCSGGLIGALGDATTPYLLTANHCFDTQASATSLQATFNFKDSTCNQQPFPPEGPASTLGSTLLATGATSDFTLVRLSQSPPAGSFLLGWSTQDISTAAGTKLYRLSHPAPAGMAWPQHYQRCGVTASPISTCSDAAQGNFIYSTQDVGGTTGGSSGAPVMLADGSIVGQLLGKCGSVTTDPCNSSAFYQLDGSFRVTYPSLSQWLNPSGSGTCATGGSQLCLNNGRFKITASWQSQSASGSGVPAQLTSDTGYFWFFNSANVEMVVKVLNACSLNSKYWVFAGGLTNVSVTVTVTDLQNGTVKTYVNPQGTAYQPVQDTSAFATCP